MWTFLGRGEKEKGAIQKRERKIGRQKDKKTNEKKTTQQN